MDKILSSCQTLNQKVLSYMHLQILATIILVLALFVLQQKLSELKLSEKKATDIIQLKEVEELKDAWLLDSLIFNEIGNKYRKNVIENASELAILTTVFLAIASNGQEENKKFQSVFNQIGELTRKLNHYRQSLIALEKATQAGTSFDDLDLQLLDHYHSYLSVESEQSNFDKEWTLLCKMAFLFNSARKEFLKKNKQQQDESGYQKLYMSDRVSELLEWGEKQLVKQSATPGDVTSSLELANTGAEGLIADAILQMTLPEDLKAFRTLRQESIKITYGFESQLKASSDTVDMYKGQLSKANYQTLRQLKADLNRDKKHIKTLQEDEKISLPIINTSVPVSLISWLLPLVNLVILVLIIQSRYRTIGLVNKLDNANLNIFNTIEIQHLNYANNSLLSWLWSMHRDTLGCFGLSMVTIYQFTSQLNLTTFELFSSYLGVYLILLFLNVLLWKRVLSASKG